MHACQALKVGFKVTLSGEETPKHNTALVLLTYCYHVFYQIFMLSPLHTDTCE